jgi:hypothetical protein
MVVPDAICGAGGRSKYAMTLSEAPTAQVAHSPVMVHVTMKQHPVKQTSVVVRPHGSTRPQTMTAGQTDTRSDGEADSSPDRRTDGQQRKNMSLVSKPARTN